MQKKYDLVTSSTSESDTTTETISRPQRVTTTVNLNNGDNSRGEGTVISVQTGTQPGITVGLSEDRFFIDSDKSKSQAISEVVQASPDTPERNRLIAASGGDPFATPTGPGGQFEEIITVLYTEGIGRQPDEGGWKYYNDQLLSGIPASTVLKTAYEDAKENINPEEINDQVFLDRIGAQENAERIFAKTGGACVNGVDPIAQTFLVNEIFYPEGIFVTSVDLFFSSKDDNLPVRIEIRPTVNGFPSSDESIPLSKVTKLPSEINLPTDQNTPVATNFAFDSPIQLPPGEYALVILTDSIKYNHYICRIGEKRLGTDDFITSQPTLGSLFKSQNARTFTPAQEDDLMFTLKKASFTTGSNFIATLSANNIAREEYSATGNTVGKFDIGVLNVNQFAEGPDLSSLYEIQTKTEGGSTDSFVAVSPNKELFFDTSKEITADSDLRFRATFQTTDTNVSPYLDLDTLGFSLVKNKINTTASITANPETSATGGGALARYITRKVTLAEGFNARALKVFLNQNMPEGASIQVYAKVLNENDETPFVDRGYQLMTRVQTNVETNEDIDEFEEFEYRLENINYTQDGILYQDFNQFAIKIVMFATNDALAPTARNLRAIALS